MKRRSANVHACSKMKARRPRVMEEDNIKCSETVFQCQMSLEEWAETEPDKAVTDDEWPSAKGVRPLEWRLSAVRVEDSMEEGEEQGADTEVEISNHGHRPPRQSSVYTPSGKEYSKVLNVEHVNIGS
ncbi:hypothetical protein AXG93_2779s1320 [Marchantia polymorpha subsp. ruderalis]|uniref:Uncharacterized protein n=1 Tax=Marchantia polymorpha subsp. ruderalis TaxID=1480154 RepID=A0A176W4X1_MARPO|nr:hypothetical protein AXG93_2779s1320 [Marchantia polymorpha subsp. ruderalis]